MAKRSAKLTRADKIRLSEEQRQAAGIDLSRPSHYALKIASENGVSDERLGDQFREKPLQSSTASSNIGQSSKALKARFGESDLRRYTQPKLSQTKSPEQYAAQRMKYFDLDDEGRFTLKETGRRFLDPEGSMSYPEVQALITMAYQGVAGFDSIMSGKISLPVCDSADKNSATFFSASPHSQTFDGHMPISNWVIERHIIINPDDPQSDVIMDIVHDDKIFSPMQIFNAFCNWANGAENVTSCLPIDPGYGKDYALVISKEAFKHITAGGNISTKWQPITNKENGPKMNIPEAAL
jgi:hypothetical protein